MTQTINAQIKFDIWPEKQMPNSKGLEIERIDENQRLKQIKAP